MIEAVNIFALQIVKIKNLPFDYHIVKMFGIVMIFTYFYYVTPQNWKQKLYSDASLQAFLACANIFS